MWNLSLAYNRHGRTGIWDPGSRTTKLERTLGSPILSYKKIATGRPYSGSGSISWQQRANITIACHNISPNHPTTIARFQMTAKDPSPSARIHVAPTISQIDKSWAKELWQDLCRDPNPLVREGCARQPEYGFSGLF